MAAGGFPRAAGGNWIDPGSARTIARMNTQSTDHLPPVRGSNHDPLGNRLREIERLLDEASEIFSRIERVAPREK